MNKLTKIGASALCGSLAAISAANAGDLSVKGGANMTWTKLGYGETGNPLGMASAMTFSGSGELDNGSTVSINIAHNDKSTYSATDISIATPSMGTFTYDEGGGTGIDRYDDMMPTAWEETDGTGVGAGLQTVSGVGGGTDIEWAVSADALPDGMAAYISWSPKPDGSANTDKSANASGSDVDGFGWDVAVEHTGLADGLKVFGGYSVIPKYKAASGVAQGWEGDTVSHVLGFTYAVGGVTLGYQESMATLDSVGSGTTAYDNQAFGVSFSVNDDLSLSYGMHKSSRGTNTGAGAIEVEAESVQMAYSMGGATLKIAETSIDNALYVSTTAGDREGTTMMLSLAF